MYVKMPRAFRDSVYTRFLLCFTSKCVDAFLKAINVLIRRDFAYK